MTTRIAIAGFGAWGRMHARALASIDDVEIAAVYCYGESSAAAAEELVPAARRFADYGAMLEAGGFDVVNVAVPNNLHAEFAVAAMEAGANVFLEKPIGLTLQACDAVIDASRRTGKLVTVNHELRVSRQWGALRELIASGELGRVRYQHLSLFRHAFRQGSGGWRYQPDRVGSWILEELVHFFDLVMWYAGENGRPASVQALGNDGEGGLARNLVAILDWTDGSRAALSQCLSGFEHHTLLEIAGDAGAARTWWSGAMDRTLHPDFALTVRSGAGEPRTISIPLSGEVFELEENLRRALHGFGEGESILPPQEARHSVEVCLAAEESLRTGQPVRLGGD
jgi:myo-inositol 2-dehydrogenase/D-chiro-inositol 1-dehydrogenase